MSEVLLEGGHVDLQRELALFGQVLQPSKQKTWDKEQPTGHQVKQQASCTNATDQHAVEQSLGTGTWS